MKNNKDDSPAQKSSLLFPSAASMMENNDEVNPPSQRVPFSFPSATSFTKKSPEPKRVTKSTIPGLFACSYAFIFIFGETVVNFREFDLFFKAFHLR